MKLLTILVVSLFSFQCVIAQNISGSLLLEKAIQYHDPNKQWNTFKGEFNIVMEMPDNSKRISHVTINLPEEYFKVKATKDTLVTEYILDKGICSISFNGK